MLFYNAKLRNERIKKESLDFGNKKIIFGMNPENQKCCGSFCNYTKIPVFLIANKKYKINEEKFQMRRISKKHLEIAKEYENLIELFFKENEDLLKLSSEYF